MDAQLPSDGTPAPPTARVTRPSAAAEPYDRKGLVTLGGLLAGLGLSLAVVFLMHVVQEASPIGSGLNIDGSVLGVGLLAGPVFGIGLAMAMTALISPPSGATRGGLADGNDHRPAAHDGD